MSSFNDVFNKKAFIAFITAGDPNLASTEVFIDKMISAGVALIEIGIPFSDPMAEGVVIQDANVRALKHNTTTDDVFDIVRRVREVTDIPLVFSLVFFRWILNRIRFQFHFWSLLHPLALHLFWFHTQRNHIVL